VSWLVGTPWGFARLRGGITCRHSLHLSLAARDDQISGLRDWGFEGIVTPTVFVRLRSEFYVHGSVHEKSISVNVQRDTTICSLYFILLQDHSTCFGCRAHPSSGVHKTVVNNHWYKSYYLCSYLTPT